MSQETKANNGCGADEAAFLPCRCSYCSSEADAFVKRQQKVANYRHRPFKIGFILIGNYSMLKLMSVLEAFELVNQQCKRCVFDLSIIQNTEQTDSKFLLFNTRYVVPPCDARKLNFDCFFLINGLIEEVEYPALSRSLAEKNWFSDFLLSFTDVLVCEISSKSNRALFKHSKYCYASSFDEGYRLALKLIQYRVSAEQALQVAQKIGIRQKKQSQSMKLVTIAPQVKTAQSIEQPVLVEAILLMQANIEEPLSMADIAAHAGVSRRHLERLFSLYINVSPALYYRNIRLHYARQLLQDTTHSILQISIASGFSSAARFSTVYKNTFGIAPKKERNLVRQAVV